MSVGVAKSKEVSKVNIVWSRVLNFFKNIFGEKTPMLAEAPEELDEEYKVVLENTEKLSNENSFETLKSTFDLYSIGTSSDGKTIAIDKKTGYEVNDKKLITKLKFATIWNKIATIHRETESEDETDPFNEGAQKTYDKICEIVQTQLKNTGNIDTAEVLNTVKTMEYKWARLISRKLFKTDIQVNALTEYFRMIVTKPKRQTKKTLTTTKALYGVDEE